MPLEGREYYFNGEESLHQVGIGRLPGRKSAAFYVVEGSVLSVLGYFTSDEAAERAQKELERLVRV